jgi:dedicator of cytokinesis protein 3
LGLGVVEEEASVQPIALKGRGTRLSFLGGRRKQSQDSTGERHLFTPAESETPTSQRSRSKEYRKSFFRTTSHDSANALPDTNLAHNEDSGPEWIQNIQAVSRKSGEFVGVVEKGSGEKGLDSSPPKVGGVRKRLSLLKIGGRKAVNPNGTIRGVVEE